VHKLWEQVDKTVTVGDVHVPSFDWGKPRKMNRRALAKAHALLVKELGSREIDYKCDGGIEVEKCEGEILYGEILKADRKQQKVWGVVLEPRAVDAQGDWLEAEDIEKACHAFMANYQRIGVDHVGKARSNIEVIECYIAPHEMKLGEQKVVKGSWVMGVHVGDAETWQRVEKGELSGFSVQGFGRRTKKGMN